MKKIRVLVLVLSLFPLGARADVEGKITGVVKDQGGDLIGGVQITIVSVRMPSRRYKTKTNAQGRFTQIGIWPDQYQVSFQKEGYATQTVEVRVAISETTDLEIHLQAADRALQRQLTEADKLFLHANDRYAQGEYEEAVRIYEEAVGLNESRWEYHFNLGLAYKKLGCAEESIRAFSQAVGLNPASFSCHKELGRRWPKPRIMPTPKTTTPGPSSSVRTIPIRFTISVWCTSGWAKVNPRWDRSCAPSSSMWTMPKPITSWAPCM